MDLHPIQGAVKILAVASTESGNKRCSDEPLSSYANFTSLTIKAAFSLFRSTLTRFIKRKRWVAAVPPFLFFLLFFTGDYMENPVL